MDRASQFAKLQKHHRFLWLVPKKNDDMEYWKIDSILNKMHVYHSHCQAPSQFYESTHVFHFLETANFQEKKNEIFCN